MRKCIVFGAGYHNSYFPVPGKDVFVIAVDGGYKRLSQLKIDIDLIIGDFDSLNIDEIKKSVSSEKIVELKKEKDETDMFFALNKGLKIGCKDFHIFGGTGGRFDHTLANLQCLTFLSQEGARGYLYGKDNIMTCIKNGEIEFDKGEKGYVSIFSQTDISKGISIEGLKYELNNAEVVNSFPLGVSNEFVGKKSKINVKEGILLVVYPNTKRRIII